MKSYVSDGRKLIDVEYDDIPNINDTVDGMRVLSKDINASGECAIFLLESVSSVCCYVLDEIYIIGKQSGFENLIEAMGAWRSGEI